MDFFFYPFLNFRPVPPPAAVSTPAAVPTALANPNPEAGVYGQAASNLVAGSNLEGTIQQIIDMGGGTWDRDTVVRALRAAFNNPERAVEYLYSGIPETAAPPVARGLTGVQATSPPVGQNLPAQPAAVPSSGPNADPLYLFPQGLPNTGSNTTSAESRMETDSEAVKVIPFQLQFDKPIASQIKLGEWNPEKDLLAMVTEDSKLLLHRFNWQRLWTISPGKNVTSLCWRPDGKAIVVGLEDGTITLHDVENGRQLRSCKLHDVAIVCLNWEEDLENSEDGVSNISTYQDHTSRFFPPPPRVPRTPGLVPADSGFVDGNDDSSLMLSNSACQRFSILCSGDIYGNICFSIFGTFPIGKINIHDLSVSCSAMDNNCLVRDASLHKVTLSKDLCRSVVLCSGELSQDGDKEGGKSHDFNCLVLDTSIFSKRKNELHQVAQQASSIEDLTEVIRTSISLMSKQWSEAMRNFHDKFDRLSTLISDHGFDSTPEEELLSLLEGARTSPPLHQFLVNTLGEAGVRRMSKVVCGAGKELQLVVLNHLQPAAEMIGFRLGELKGLSKWRARFQGIGLDEKLVDNATEKAGILLVHIERFLGVLSSVVQQFSNFFSWLLKSVKSLMSESSDQPVPFNSELVVIFLRFLYNQDPVMKLLKSTDSVINVNVESMQRIKELVRFGGFSDTEYLKRTFGKEFQHMESCFKEAFMMPFATVSRKITAKSLLPLFPIGSSPKAKSMIIPTSVSYYKEDRDCTSRKRTSQHGYTECISVKVPEDSISTIPKGIFIARRLLFDHNNPENDSSIEAALLCVPDGYNCVDLSLYKDQQLVLLLNETTTISESSGNACMVIVQTDDLPFVPLSQTNNGSSWNFQDLESSLIDIQLENEKVRSIPHAVVSPLAVSASRGVACVFAARKRALVYILEEDEEEVLDSD